MEVEIISRDCIKPSSPTPLHLRTYKLCLFDQFYNFQHHTPIVLYYPVNQNTNLSIISTRLQKLRQSLPETLALFYPFAGKIKDNLSIDCNDEGIYFIEARAKISLHEFLNQINLTSINKFIPFHASEQGGSISGTHVAKIQVTTFSCGGLAICTSISHLLGDAMSNFSFFKSWAAAVCQNPTEAVRPNYNASFLFPQNDAFPKGLTWGASCAKFALSGRIVTQRFVFDAKAIATLKAKATSSYVQNPSRMEVVSAFLSKCIMNVRKNKTDSKPTLLTLFVNLRQKTGPQLSKYSTGNIIWPANALCTNEQEELDSLVYLMRKAIVEVNGDVVKRFQGEGGFLKLCEVIKDSNMAYSSAADRIIFSSVTNIGFYDIDYGWGKPIWISFPYFEGFSPNSVNSIVLTNTRSGDGIEAWLYNLDEEDVNILQHDEELLAFATMNPSPLGVKNKLPTSHL